jgi:hypothetical protein
LNGDAAEKHAHVIAGNSDIDICCNVTSNDDLPVTGTALSLATSPSAFRPDQPRLPHGPGHRPPPGRWPAPAGSTLAFRLTDNPPAAPKALPGVGQWPFSSFRFRRGQCLSLSQ